MRNSCNTSRSPDVALYIYICIIYTTNKIYNTRQAPDVAFTRLRNMLLTPLYGQSASNNCT